MKIINILIALIVIGILCSCGAPISKANIEEAEEKCKTNGGISYIFVGLNEKDTIIYCNNGAAFNEFKSKRY